MSSPFDEAKYNALLKGLEVSVVRLSEVREFNEIFRYDAEYFNKYSVQLVKKIRDNKHCLIGEEFDVSKLAGFEFTEWFTPTNMESENYYIALTSKNIQNERLELSDYITIDKNVADLNLSRSKIYDGDVVLSYTGEYRRALTLQEKCAFQLGPNICRLRPKGRIVSSFYLSTFLNSKIGQTILDKEKTLSAQPTVAMSRIRLIPIPILSSDFQQKIESLVKSAHAKLAESKSLYAQAEDTLLSELGLKDWQPKNENTSVKTLSDFKASGRLDAEFYQPKYDELEAKIKSVPYKTISELQTFNARGVQPDYIPDGTVSVVNSKHILENGLDYDNFEKTTTDFLKNNEKAAIKQNDILIYTTGANIGRTQPYLLSEPALASNHVNILRLSNVNPLYAAFVLNSKIGRLQTEKACTGSAQAELYPSDIEKFLLPILPQKTQEQIAELITKSFELQSESKRLLEEAKKMVEKEIEAN